MDDILNTEGDVDTRINQQTSYIRLMHAAPNAPAVDVYVNNRIYRRNIKFAQVTEYAPTAPGVYNVKVYPTGTSVNPVINSNLTLPPNSNFTVAVITSGERFRLFPVRDPMRPRMPGMGFVRVVNFSPNAGSVNVSLREGRQVFRDVIYTEVTDYNSVRPGNYTVNVFDRETGRLILNAPNQRVRNGSLQTIYLLGLRRGTPSLRIVTTLDAGTYRR